ncbi:Rho GTPase-activating protein [Abortiporus biennis]
MATSTPTKIGLVIPQSTPNRSTLRPDGPSYQFSSPQRTTAPSTILPSPSPASSSSATAGPISVESLLQAHASTQNPALAALEVAVNDRNQLSAQNTQLWKLIEKQRAGYSQLMKELERVRGERDTYRSKLHNLGENTDALLKAHREKEKEKREREGKDSSSNNLRSAASYSYLKGGEIGAIGSSHNADSRIQVSRTHSEDSSTRAGSRTLASSRSREPMTSSELPYSGRERQGSQSSLNISTSQMSSAYLSTSQASSSTNLTISSATSVPPSTSSSNNNIPIPVQERVSDTRKPSPLTLATPVRSGSLPTLLNDAPSAVPLSAYPTSAIQQTPNTSQLFSANVPPLRTAQKSSTLPPSGIVLTPATPGIVPSIHTNGDTVRGRESEDSSVSSSTYSHTNGTPSSQSSIPSVSEPPFQTSSGSGDLSVPVRPQAASRESRISLPDEAKRYYASMGESPVPSPQLTQGFPALNGTSLDTKQTGLAPNASLPEVQTPEVVVNGDYGQRARANSHSSSHQRHADDSGEFLELEDEDSSTYERTSGSERVSTIEEADDEDLHVDPSIAQNGKKRAAVEDFPLPPTTPPSLPSGEVFSQAQMQALTSQRPQPDPYDSRSMVSGVSHYSATTADSHKALLDPRPPQDQPPPSPFTQSLVSAEPPQATFRALPLLTADLPHTNVLVSHSSIRANDRGKEVLSFVISVDPGSGKQPWKVEKLYSDVLTLDARVRATIGKSVGKKLVSLPEGRLWRDHAPAKVDQRKAALETYFKSLIQLPVKNKDEVIAFLTSDIVREAQKPVARAGYKEGYLTKRGKNFGGWKSRYFVLQGPSLEYYESRGGTHLGSIQITGAQIGRQQRSPDKQDADENNEYRHAFLIIEAKKAPNGSSSRHVLCAQSDKERDSWVEELVRYVSGTYNEDEQVVVQNTVNFAPRTSTSSETHGTPTRRLRKEDISKGSAIPPDSSNPKLFPVGPHPDDQMQMLNASPVKSIAPSTYAEHRIANGLEPHLSTSLPTASPLSASEDVDVLVSVSQRANSELGHYPDLVDQRVEMPKHRVGRLSPEQHRRKDKEKDKRRSMMPLKGSPMTERAPSPDPDTPRVDAHGKVKISAPMNGTPIPAGYKFGKEPTPDQTPSSDRREKAKSRTFWSFGRQHADKPAVPAMMPRAVFGVGLEDSLDVAQIASLPAIVFRCIQYLEANKADQEEGIYRLSGSSAVIKALKDRFNMEGDVDLLGSDDYWDPHAIAGLLKTFLRELPASILTRDLHLRFLAVIDLVDPQERIAELSYLISCLPVANYSLLRALTAHLILIVQNAHVNKMTMRNVGIVFSPTLGIPAGVFSLMLGEFRRVFNVDGTQDEGDAEASEKDGKPEEEDMARRNSKHYSDAAADQLLGLVGRSLQGGEDDNSDEGGESLPQDESGAEDATAESESLIDSSAASSSVNLAQETNENRTQPSEHSGSSQHKSHASEVAASRGLNLAISDKSTRRQSRMMGLPLSPRPPHSASPHTPSPQSNTPRSPAHPPVSPLQTPK